jgi:hypothetical protein
VLTDPNVNAPLSLGAHRPLAETDPEVVAATAAELRGQRPTGK